VVAIAAASLAVVSVGRSDAAAATGASTKFGEAGRGSVTVNVPPPVTHSIYGAPSAQGRPIVLIDAGHGGRDPGAISVSGEV